MIDFCSGLMHSLLLESSRSELASVPQMIFLLQFSVVSKGELRQGEEVPITHLPIHRPPDPEASRATPAPRRGVRPHKNQQGLIASGNQCCGKPEQMVGGEGPRAEECAGGPLGCDLARREKYFRPRGAPVMLPPCDTAGAQEGHKEEGEVGRAGWTGWLG